ncbi:hypothetical protein DL768_008815 [Monosporascus sp. mg162]|nr:hypothetical protein DL768_008815 [Monosporascus sp. mg162]
MGSLRPSRKVDILAVKAQPMRSPDGLVPGSAGASAQFPPEPEGVTVLRSQFHENVTISFKDPGICETTPGVKSYSGYVHLPPGFLDDGEHGGAQDYPINTFFWFFEARNRPAAEAPLAIWLNGGPGASSMMGLLQGNGPCFVADDSAATYLNPWSWNNEVNMLYLDQPAQVGFSYDVPTNATVRLRGAEDGEDYYEIVPTNFTSEVDFGKLLLANLTTGVGTFGSQRLDHTANTTARAAHALWHFAQTWFTEFPHYRPVDDRISLWAEGYGGHYGPGIMRFFQEMNEKIATTRRRSSKEEKGEEKGKGKGIETEKDAHYLHLDTLGIVNGLIDMVTQIESYITFPSYNTYGIHIFDQSLQDKLWHNWTRPHGCKEQVSACAEHLRDQDQLPLKRNPLSLKNIGDVCTNATEECAMAPWTAYRTLIPDERVRGWYDIAHPKHDPFPAPYYLGYLRHAHVQAALGVPVNYTARSAAVAAGFEATHDLVRGGFLEDVAYLLDAGVKVHLMYGDRDFACNWVGGEAASLAVPHARRDEFANAGYAEMLLTEPDASGEWRMGGLTRQLGNFSFTRVFQAGHEVPSYAPEAAYRIFNRAMFGRDVATGKVRVDDGYKTRGPPDAWDWLNMPPDWPHPRCYILEPLTCAPEVWERVKKGAVVVKDWFVVGDNEKNAENGKGWDGMQRLKEDDQDVIGDL